mmetsp:Transcript_20757/g.45649  ORF Transcript_20757/g.45649 Transcript_20757/m.45649 type:complete len:414 (+) Transcript_20757:508-1749(+)
MGHVEGSIPVYQNSQSLRLRHLHTDGEGKAGSHNAQTSTSDHGAWLRPADKLAGHHLVVSHTSAYHDLSIIHPLLLMEVLVRCLDDLLHLELPTRGLHVAKCVVLLPRRALLQPLASRTALLWFGDVLLHCPERICSVCPDGDCRPHDLSEAGLVDVDVDYTAGALLLGGLGLGRILRHNAGSAVVEAAADGYDNIRVLDGKVRIGGPMHAKHVHGERIALIEDAHRVTGGCHWNLCLVRNCFHQLGAMARTLPHVEDGALGLVEELSGRPHLCHVEHGRGVPGLLHGTLEDGLWHLRPHGNDVLGKIDVDRARSTRRRYPEGLIHSPRELVEVQADVIPLRARPSDLRRRALLEGVCSHGSCGHLSRENDHGHAVRHGILQRRHNVRDAGAARHHNDAGDACRLGVGSCCVA